MACKKPQECVREPNTCCWECGEYCPSKRCTPRGMTSENYRECEYYEKSKVEATISHKSWTLDVVYEGNEYSVQFSENLNQGITEYFVHDSEGEPVYQATDPTLWENLIDECESAIAIAEGHNVEEERGLYGRNE